MFKIKNYLIIGFSLILTADSSASEAPEASAPETYTITYSGTTREFLRAYSLVDFWQKRTKFAGKQVYILPSDLTPDDPDTI